MNSILTGAATNFPPLTQQHTSAPETPHPVQTLVQFFDEFHPQNVRDEIRQLCEVAVTTDNSTYDSGHKRSNLLCFSQKLDELVRACETIVQRHDAFKKYDHPPDAWEEPDNEYEEDDPEDPAMPFQRPELLSEALPDDPEFVLQEVFTSMHLYDFREDALPKWLKAALTNGNSSYCESEERTALLQLYDALLLLIEAMHLIMNKTNKNPARAATPPTRKCRNTMCPSCWKKRRSHSH